MHKKTILLFLFTLLIINGFSQLTNNKFKVTFSFSPFVSNYNIDFEENQYIKEIKYNSNINYGAQLRFEKQFCNLLALQTGIKYHYLTFSSEFPSPFFVINEEDPYYFKETRNFQLFAIPLNVKLFFLNTKKINLFFKYGGSINAIIGANYKLKLLYENGEIHESTKNTKDDYNQFSFSMNGGFGLEYKITNKLFIGGEIDYQYLNIKKTDSFNLRINNISLDFSVGIYI